MKEILQMHIGLVAERVRNVTQTEFFKDFWGGISGCRL
jgi:hypothetical protein